MFGVLSQMEMEPSTLDDRQLDHMMSVISGSAGFRRGYLAREVQDRRAIHGVVMFDEIEDAAAFADGVAKNVPSARVRVVEIIADAQVP